MKLLFLIIISFFLISPSFSESNISSMVKPENATQAIKGQFGPYSIWEDLSKWKIVKEFPKEKEEDFVFCLQDNLMYGNFLAQALDKRSKDHDVKSAFLEKISTFVTNQKILLEEKRIVNGVDVLYLQISGDTSLVNLVFDALLYSGNHFNVMISTTCNQDFRTDYENYIEEFLSGLVIGKLKAKFF